MNSARSILLALKAGAISKEAAAAAIRALRAPPARSALSETQKGLWALHCAQLWK